MDFYFAGYVIVEPYTEYDDYEAENDYLIHPDYSLESKRQYYLWNEYNKLLPGCWAWKWCNPREPTISNIKIRFSLNNDQFTHLQNEYETLLENDKVIAPYIDIPIFKDKSDAINIYNKYFINKLVKDIKILGIYCPDIFIDDLLESNNAYMKDILQNKIQLCPNDETIIGYDVINSVNFGLNIRHHGFKGVEQIKLSLTNYGLISSFDDAMLLRLNANTNEFKFSMARIDAITKEVTYGDTDYNNWIIWGFTEVKL